MDDTRLHEAMELLGALLSERGQPSELVAVGGGALLLLGLSQRATVDLDVVARRSGPRWTKSRPLPEELAQAVDEVASDELLRAVRWCRAKDGTASFVDASGALEILKDLGVPIDPDELDADHG